MGAVLLSAFPPAARAQRSSSIPSASHYRTLELVARGEFGAAGQICRDSLGSATKVGQQRWIDSICYYAVLGECEYLAGDLNEALSAFESALDIYMSVPDWIARVEYPTGTRHTEGAVPPWGAGLRNLPLCVFPNDAMIRIGDPITDERIKQGGMLKNPELKKIDPVEIFRCTALALRRRNEILGPLTPADHRTRPIVECFSKRAVSRNHWSSPLLDVMLGIALEGAGKHEEAVDRLNKSLLMEGEYNHFLAADALLTLGDIYIRSGKIFEAADSYLEASVSAYAYGNWDETEEALRKLAGADILRDDPQTAFPFEACRAWASDQIHSGWIAASLDLAAAGKLIRLGLIDQAEAVLRSALPLLKSARLGESRYGDLYRYLASVVRYRQGDSGEGEELLAQACAGARARSFRFFQIHRLNDSLDSVTPRTAADLYEVLLRISDYYDWVLDPAASFAADTSLWTEELGNQFLLAVDRDQQEKAFETAERIRVRRFLAPLEMGGRAFSLRCLTAAPEETLSEEERVFRRNLLVDYPALDSLRKEAETLGSQLRPFTLAPPEAERPAREALLARLESVSAEEETLLRGIAAMPIAVPEVFPPRIPFEELRAKMPEKAAILSFIEVDGGLYGFFVTRGEFDAWRLGSVGGVGGELASFLSACGASDSSKAKLLKEFTSGEWREAGSSFFLTLLGHPTADDARGSALFEKLAVVPDSILWYVPYGAMTLPRGDELVPIESVPNFTLFCAPTVSLCFARGESAVPLRSETVIVPGELHPKEDADIQREALERLSGSLPKTALWTGAESGAPQRLLLSLSDRLLVYHEIRAGGAGWPAAGAESKKREALPVLDLRFLPWGGPKTALFPGLRSGGEAALKDQTGGAEFFAPILVLESQGAQNLLFSRWRVGGDSAYRLCESFLELSEKNPAPEAWKETLAGFMTAPLNLKEEPRFRGTPPKEPLSGEHPFFWGGYMLVCRGLIPFTDESAEAADAGPEAPGEDGAQGAGGETPEPGSEENGGETPPEETGSESGTAEDDAASAEPDPEAAEPEEDVFETAAETDPNGDGPAENAVSGESAAEPGGYRGEKVSSGPRRGRRTPKKKPAENGPAP